jgi:ATP-dependent Clp protease ATP-binding subunit ClpC
MFERFTDRARHVVVLAQEEARLLNHSHIGTEHLLLGLLHESQGVAARALEALGISLESARTEVERMIGRGEGVPSGHIPFTPRAKKVLELSLREALNLDHNYIGTEHILLGLIREQEGVAAQALFKLGAREERVRQKVLELLRSAEPGEAESLSESAVRARTGDVGRSISGRLDDLLTRLQRIEHRLTGIERTLGRHTEPAGAEFGGAGEPQRGGEPGAGAGPSGDPPAPEPPAAEGSGG